MASVQTLGGLMLALTLGMTPSSETLQKVLYTATVNGTGAEVRSGPSTDPKMYATNRLRAGTVVEVVKKRDDGWLEIKPPPGSFSWINTRFLERLDQRTWVVVSHDDAPVPILLGSELINEKPGVIGARVARGSQVVALGKEIPADDGMWMPIEPPPGEVRYVRADAVAANPAPGETTPPPTTTAAAPPAGPPSPTGAAPEGPPAPGGGFALTRGIGQDSAMPPPAAAPPGADPLWTEAQEAERAGRLTEAEEKYKELAHKVCNQNHDLAMQCYNRIYFLREGSRSAGTGTETRYGASGADSRLYPVPANPSNPQANVSSPCPPPQQSNYAPAPAATAEPRTSEPGVLKRAHCAVDSRPTYLLLSSQGDLRMYVTAQPGLDLEPYVDHPVQVYGPLVYRLEFRAYQMTAQRVLPQQ